MQCAPFLGNPKNSRDGTEFNALKNIKTCSGQNKGFFFFLFAPL